MVIVVVEDLMKDLRHTVKVVLMNSFLWQPTTQVLPPSLHPLLLEPTCTPAVVLGRAEKSVKKKKISGTPFWMNLVFLEILFRV